MRNEGAPYFAVPCSVGTLQRAFLHLSWLLLLGGALAGQEWTRFRGPNGSGRSDAQGIPTEWTEQEFEWKVAVPAEGISQPVIWGEKVFLTGAAGEGAERLVLCLRARDGVTEWRQPFPSKTHSKHQRNTYASSTPVVDAGTVYAIFGTPASILVLALDHAGKEIWRRDLGPFVGQHGNGSSPILFQDLVIIANEQGNEKDGDSFLIALDRKTGQTRWKTPRRSEEAAYATPCLLEREGAAPELIFSSHAHGLCGVDPRTGAVSWEARVFDKRVVSSPVIAAGLVVGTCGSGGGGNFAIAVRPGGKGDVTETHMAYKLQKSIAYVPGPIARGELLFFWSDKGVVTCAEAASGKVLWQERAEGSYSGSPVCIGDRIYCMSEEGEAVVVAAAREFKLLARNPMGEGSRSSPAVAGGRLYLRTYRHLIALGGKKPSGGRAEAGAGGSK